MMSGQKTWPLPSMPPTNSPVTRNPHPNASVSSGPAGRLCDSLSGATGLSALRRSASRS